MARWSWPLAAVAHFPKRPKHARIISRNRLRNAAALALTGVLTFTGVAAGAATNHISTNINAVDVDQIFNDFNRETAHERPTQVSLPEAYGTNRALNILILGLDSRDGDNAEFATDEVDGVRSDTVMVMHVSADRRHVTMISIPRDSVVDIPSCPTTTPGRFTQASSNTRFNAAFSLGYNRGGDIESGAMCTMTTVESLTNVQLDGFIAMDFAGFTRTVHALGGVEMCIEQEIYSPKAGHLHLLPGCQTLDRWQAFQLMRARTGVGLGDGSDLTRIRRQQQLLSAIADRALSLNLVTEPHTLLRFLSATTASMTASSNFASINGLTALGMTFNGISSEDIEFMTVPIAGNPEDRNTVIWTRAADELWHNVRYNTLYGDVSTDDGADSDLLDAEGDEAATPAGVAEPAPGND